MTTWLACLRHFDSGTGAQLPRLRLVIGAVHRAENLKPGPDIGSYYDERLLILDTLAVRGRLLVPGPGTVHALTCSTAPHA